MTAEAGDVEQLAENILKLYGLRSEEHTSELQSHSDLVCRLLLEKKHTRRQQEKEGTTNGHAA